MKTFVKQTTAFVLLLVFVFACPAQAFALTISAQSAILIDADTGQVLFEQNPDQALVPASMTKLMTVYIVMDQIAKGNATLDSKVTITPETSALSKNRTFSNVPLESNRTYSLEELLSSILVVSACGSTKAVAEHFGETEAHFAEMMNQYAQDMGLAAYFVDSSGISGYNEITARSMAILGNRLIQDYPAVLTYTKYSELPFDGKIYKNSNKMLIGMPYSYFGVDGLKTGFTTKAKYCFTASAMIEDVRLISVIMGSDSLANRFEETKNLLDYGFALKNIHEPGRWAWAKPTASTILVNGESQPLAVYEIQGNHYFKLRDLAFALNNTNSTFSVGWDQHLQALTLKRGAPYQSVGGEMILPSSAGIDSVTANPQIYLDGNKVHVMAFTIGDNYYFKLRDLGTLLDFNVTWDNTTKTVGIETF